MTKSGTGTITLTGANSYTGTTTISSGALNIQNPTALGTTAAGTSVSKDASLQLQGGITIGAEALTLNGATTPFNGTDLTGALRNISGTNTYNGAITLASQAAIASDLNTLALFGTINNGGNRLIMTGTASIIAAGSISGAGDLLKQNTGSLVVIANNTFGGNNAVFLDRGTISVGTGGTLGTTNGTSTGWINIGASVTGQNGDGTLLIRDAGITLANPIDARFFSGVPGTVTLGTGYSSGTGTFSGTLALHDNVIISTASGATLAFTGQIQNGSLAGANNQTTGQGLVGGIGGGLTLNGGGTVILSGSNSYVGGTTMNTSSILGIGNDSALGTGGLTINGASTSIFASGGARTIANNLALSNGGLTLTGSNALTINGTTTLSVQNRTIDNAVTAVTPSLTLAGNVYLAENNSVSRTLTFGTNATSSLGTTLISGIIANNSGANTLASNLVVGGGGKVILAGNNTYTGTTTIQNTGTILQVGNGGTSGNLSAGTVNLNTSSNLSFNRSDTITVGNTISGGTGSLSQIGAGKTILTGANSYTGATTVSSGILNIRHATALGTTTGGTTVSNGATLQLETGITVGAEALNIRGTGAAGQTARSSASAARTITAVSSPSRLLRQFLPTAARLTSPTLEASREPPSVLLLPAPAMAAFLEVSPPLQARSPRTAQAHGPCWEATPSLGR